LKIENGLRETQVAIQTRLKIQGRDALVAVRLKVDRGKISEDWVTAGLQVPEIETKKRTPSRNQNTSCELLGLFPPKLGGDALA
jgi:hypothetical protein